jgi:RNA polymerase sigma-70 factor (ECF subfamily)
VFLKAFRGIRGFRRGSSLKTWLYRIAVREALNHRRWLWRHHRQQASIDTEQAEGHASLEIEDESRTPFDEAASNEVQHAVQQALRSVPAVFRSAVILRDLEGMSYEEVAEVLEVSVGTVKSRILRGRRLLREILEPFLVDAHGVHRHAARETKNASGHVGSQVHGIAARHASETVMHSPLFSTMKEKTSSQRDTAGWANPGKPGDVEGGV